MIKPAIWARLFADEHGETHFEDIEFPVQDVHLRRLRLRCSFHTRLLRRDFPGSASWPIGAMQPILPLGGKYLLSWPAS